MAACCAGEGLSDAHMSGAIAVLPRTLRDTVLLPPMDAWLLRNPNLPERHD
jgi:hypothetical protein